MFCVLTLVSCDIGQVIDIVDEDARVDCNLLEHKSAILNVVSIASERNGFISNGDLYPEEEIIFSVTMRRGPAFIHIRNSGTETIWINSSVTPASENDIYDGKDIDLIVDELSEGFIEVCAA